jgi:hypothetical protein
LREGAVVDMAGSAVVICVLTEVLTAFANRKAEQPSLARQ